MVEKLPLAYSSALMTIYIMGFVVQFLVIRYCKDQLKYGNDFDVSVNLSIEFGKLLACFVIFSARNEGKFLLKEVVRKESYRTGIFYLIPAFLYTCYNHLTFWNLSFFDNATFSALMQSRVIFTGIFFVVLLKTPLSAKKWLSLILLAVGVGVKFFSWNMQISPYVGLLFLQASCSSFAGVYNEYLLKKDVHMDVFEQNFFMYSFGIFLNLMYMLYFSYDSLFQFKLFNTAWFYLLVCNGVLIGIVTSLILKYVNSIVKGFASAVEIFITSLAAVFFLNATLTPQDFIAAVIVTVSIALYNYA